MERWTVKNWLSCAIPWRRNSFVYPQCCFGPRKNKRKKVSRAERFSILENTTIVVHNVETKGTHSTINWNWTTRCLWETVGTTNNLSCLCVMLVTLTNLIWNRWRPFRIIQSHPFLKRACFRNAICWISVARQSRTAWQSNSAQSWRWNTPGVRGRELWLLEEACSGWNALACRPKPRQYLQEAQTHCGWQAGHTLGGPTQAGKEWQESTAKLGQCVQVVGKPNGVHHQAAAALRGLAVNDENKLKIVERVE